MTIEAPATIREPFPGFLAINNFAAFRSVGCFSFFKIKVAAMTVVQSSVVIAALSCVGIMAYMLAVYIPRLDNVSHIVSLISCPRLPYFRLVTAGMLDDLHERVRCLHMSVNICVQT